MIAQILAGAALAVTGTLTAALGALFMISALGILHRHVIGLALICAGAALIIAGVRFFRRAEEKTTRGIRKQLITLAENQYGIVKSSQIAVHLGKSETVTRVINALLQEGAVLKRTSGDILLFVFPEFLQRRTCTSCGKDYILLSPETECPACSQKTGPRKTKPVIAHETLS